VLGLGVMGRSLALNVADRGFSVAVWNRAPEPTAAALEASGGRLLPASTLEELVGLLARPRKLLLMVTAGAPVDLLLDSLIDLLEPGDVVVDGGNSWHLDTQRREQRLAERGLHFLGLGVSGGEEGARHGPSLMPGGSAEGYGPLRPILEAIAARTEAGLCVTHVGPGGAGHFVKMVHNGLEYADMQLLAEGYELLGSGLGFDPPRLAEVFETWNEGPLASFLVEISAQIFRKRDPDGDGWLVERVLDRAAHKGTGRWTVESALALGVAVPSIGAALDGRVLSSMKSLRGELSRRLPRPAGASRCPGLTEQDVADALLAGKITAYAQGFQLLAEASREHGYGLDLAELARIWKGGCIIRARFLDPLGAAYGRVPEPKHLFLDPVFAQELERLDAPWRRVVMAAAKAALPVPCLSAGLAYRDALTRARLPQNLVQAQRDAFGAHTFVRDDDPSGAARHEDWLGGDT
jgi:6-phosphogluconate dehydrogenase